MFASSLSDYRALVAAEPALVGHPVLVVDVQATELAALREANADLRRQLNRHSACYPRRTGRRLRPALTPHSRERK